MSKELTLGKFFADHKFLRSAVYANLLIIVIAIPLKKVFNTS